MRSVVSAGLVIILIAASAAEARIIRRHDQPDAAYVEAARHLPRPIVLARAPRGASNGMGTFVAPNWILTAAHVAGELTVGGVLPDDPGLKVERIVPHPTWNGDTGDLALVQVSGDHSAYRPVAPCRGGDAAGAHLWLIGAGDHGDGQTGPSAVDRQMRAAENQIDAVDGSTLRFDFDAPETALELEGISGPGDSGGPAVIAVGDGHCLAGVSSRQIAERGQRGRYGAIEVYSRVSTAADWIEGVTGGR